MRSGTIPCSATEIRKVTSAVIAMAVRWGILARRDSGRLHPLQEEPRM